MSHFESDEEESCSSSSSSSTACRKRSHGDAAALATKKRAVDDETSTSEQSGEAEAPPAPRAACVPWVTHDATVAQHFVLLTQLSHTLRADFGAAQRNMAKNRYANVLANDETRVRLSAECGAEGDYVNANLCASGRFIATQAPLEHTVADFWTMLLEQRTRGTLPCARSPSLRISENAPNSFFLLFCFFPVSQPNLISRCQSSCA